MEIESEDMNEYHPTRYLHLKSQVEIQHAKLGAALDELALRLEFGSPAYEAEARALLIEEIRSASVLDALLNRNRILNDVHQAWSSGTQLIFDMTKICRDEPLDWDHTDLLDFYIPDENFYIHLGQEAGFKLKTMPATYVDGMYVKAASLNGVGGLNFTFVCNQLNDGYGDPGTYREALSEAGQSVFAWIEMEAKLGGLRVREPWSDPSMLSDPTIFEVVENLSEIMVRLCAAENTIEFKQPRMRH